MCNEKKEDSALIGAKGKKAVMTAIEADPFMSKFPKNIRDKVWKSGIESLSIGEERNQLRYTGVIHYPNEGIQVALNVLERWLCRRCNNVGENQNYRKYWRNLLKFLNIEEPDSRRLPLLTVYYQGKELYEDSDIEVICNILPAIEGYDRELRLFAAWCAEDVLSMFTDNYQGENWPKQAIEAAEKFANWEIEEEGLRSAWKMAKNCATKLQEGNLSLDTNHINGAKEAAWAASASTVPTSAAIAARNAALWAWRAYGWTTGKDKIYKTSPKYKNFQKELENLLGRKERYASCVGIDLGIIRFATLFDGTTGSHNFEFLPDEIKVMETHVKDMKSKKNMSTRFFEEVVDEMQNPVLSEDEIEKKIQSLTQEIENVKEGFLRGLSARIVERYSRICIEELSYKDMTYATDDDKKMWEKFKKLLEEEVEKNPENVKIVFIDPRNTSRTCSMCGCIDEESRPIRSQFICIFCGHTEDADVNAAKNILRLGNKKANEEM